MTVQLLTSNERAIHRLIESWHLATAAGDVDAVLKLMSKDVVFLTAGRPPMRGRELFASGLRKLLETHRIESSAKIHEIVISGPLAYSWAELTVKIVPLGGGSPTVRTGNTLSVFRMEQSEEWLLVRDANLLPAPA